MKAIGKKGLMKVKARSSHSSKVIHKAVKKAVTKSSSTKVIKKITTTTTVKKSGL